MLGAQHKTVVVEPAYEGCLADRHWAVVRPAERSEQEVHDFLASRRAEDLLQGARTGVTIPGLRLADIAGLDVEQ